VESIESLGLKVLNKNIDIRILVEIIGMTNLTNDCCLENEADVNPFVSVSFKNEVIHETSTLKKNANPIFDVKERSLFVWRTNPETLMKKESFLKLNAYHRVNFGKSVRNLIKGSTKLIGEAAMKLLDIVECCCDDDISSKRIEVDLIFNNKSQGKIALRFRLATNYDVDFLNRLSKRQVVTQKNDHLVTEKGAIGVLNVGESLPSVNTAFFEFDRKFFCDSKEIPSKTKT